MREKESGESIIQEPPCSLGRGTSLEDASPSPHHIRNTVLSGIPVLLDLSLSLSRLSVFSLSLSAIRIHASLFSLENYMECLLMSLQSKENESCCSCKVSSGNRAATAGRKGGGKSGQERRKQEASLSIGDRCMCLLTVSVCCAADARRERERATVGIMMM